MPTLEARPQLRGRLNIAIMTSSSCIPAHRPLEHYRLSVVCLLAFFTSTCCFVFVRSVLRARQRMAVSKKSASKGADGVSQSVPKTMPTKRGKPKTLTMTKKAAIVQQLLSDRSQVEVAREFAFQASPPFTVPPDTALQVLPYLLMSGKRCQQTQSVTVSGTPYLHSAMSPTLQRESLNYRSAKRTQMGTSLVTYEAVVYRSRKESRLKTLQTSTVQCRHVPN